MNKGIFIGIGGTGVITVAHLKSKILQHYGGDKDKMLKDNHFIFLDTDEYTRKEVNQNTKLKSIFKGEPPIDNYEFENLGATKPYQIYNTAKTSSDVNSQRLLEWIVDPDIPGNYQIPNTELQSGAGASRIAGRTSVYKKWDQIVNKINAGVSIMTGYEAEGKVGTDKLDESKPSIWVFGSCCGGTGSAAILDVLYIADRVYQKKFNTNPYLRLILYMPKPFIHASKDNISFSLNAFSTFWELNAFRFDAKNLNDGKKFKHFSCKPDEINWESIPGQWNVYSYMLAVDAETDKNKLIKLDDLFINTAELCFYMHTCTAGDTMVSRLDNDINNTQLINNPRTDTLTDFKWTKSLLAAGYKTICKPNDLLNEFIKTRFLSDFFSLGMIKSINEQSINYSTNYELIKEIQKTTDKCFQNYFNLAGKFYRTRENDFVAYIPDVSEFVDKSGWKDNHLFEIFYSQLFKTFQHSENTIELNVFDFEGVFKEIFADSLQRDLDEWVSDKRQDVTGFLIDIEKKAIDFIEKKISESNHIQNWFDKTLEQTVEEYFHDGNKLIELNSHISKIPVLYPTRDGSSGASQIRYLVISNSLSLAQKFGYDRTDFSHQFIQNKDANKLILIKIEVGHNLFDYKYFDELQSIYERHKNEIANHQIGCFIHKEFVHLDLDLANLFI